MCFFLFFFLSFSLLRVIKLPIFISAGKQNTLQQGAAGASRKRGEVGSGGTRVFVCVQAAAAADSSPATRGRERRRPSSR